MSSRQDLCQARFTEYKQAHLLKMVCSDSKLALSITASIMESSCSSVLMAKSKIRKLLFLGCLNNTVFPAFAYAETVFLIFEYLKNLRNKIKKPKGPPTRDT